MSGDSIEALVKNLESDNKKAREYFFNTVGVDADDDEQLTYGILPFQDYGYLSEDATIHQAFTDTESLHKELCVMSKAKTASDLQNCVDKYTFEREFLN